MHISIQLQYEGWMNVVLLYIVAAAVVCKNLLSSAPHYTMAFSATVQVTFCDNIEDMILFLV